jgi:hypothetical protein
MTAPRRLDSPAVPMVATIPLMVGFVVLRWMDAAHRSLGAFVLAGSRYATAARVPKGLPVRPGSGYDGQFYYRLALNPFDLARASYGIRFDALSRIERIGYPFLSWALAWGRHDEVPLSLVVVNVLAAAVLGLAGGLLARSAGRHAVWGLVFPLYWGYVWTLGRDLSELTTAALVVMALAALMRNEPVWAGLAFLGAVVSKETAILLVGTLAVTTVWLRGTGRTAGTLGLGAPSPRGSIRLAPRHSDLAFLIPLAGFVLWQFVLLLATGKVPIFESGGENLGPPFIGLYHGIDHYFGVFPDVAAALWLGEFAVLVVLVVSVATQHRHAPSELQVMWAVSVLLGLCAATGIWLGDVGFRSLDDIYLLSWVVLLFHPRKLMPWAALCGGAWCLVAAELIRYI